MNSFKIIRRRAFRQDLIENYLIIAEEQPSAAERFAQSVDTLLSDLAKHPKSGREWHTSSQLLKYVRYRIVPGFKVLIFYIIEDNTLIMLRALHGSRGDIQTLLTDITS